MFDLVIDAYYKKEKNLFFIQLGACDGIFCDPVRKYILKYRLSGILVEPVKYLFDRLVKNYEGHDNLIFENVAISKRDEVKKFYYISQEVSDMQGMNIGLGPLLGSFIPHSLKDGWTQVNVNCIALKTLLAKHNVRKIDLLQIDAEGYDYEIIKQVDFNAVKPKIIHYEHINLKSDEQEECIMLLARNGYIVIEGQWDTLAFLKPGRLNTRIYMRVFCNMALQILTKVWHKLSG